MADARRVIPVSSPSCRHRARAVKQGWGGVRTNAPSGRLARHLEGWQLGVLSVGIAMLGALLFVPHAVRPDVLPLPRVDRREQSIERELEHRRAEQARAQPLPFEVRTVGERMRRYGRAAAAGDGSAVHAELVELGRAAALAKARLGTEPLLSLRAVQGELFAGALRRWEATGKSDDELVELGGDFLEKARQSRWLSGKHRLIATDDERATLFRIRWSHLTGLLSTHPFTPTLDEWRAYFRFLLEHPEGKLDDCSPMSRPSAQLRYVAAIEKHDPEYPALLARGVLEERLGAPGPALLAYQGFLETAPHGPWFLRARNYLASARAQVRDSVGPD